MHKARLHLFVSGSYTYHNAYYSFLQFLAVPCIAGVLLVNTPSASYGLLFLAYITAETWLGPAASIVQVLCIHDYMHIYFDATHLRHVVLHVYISPCRVYVCQQ